MRRLVLLDMDGTVLMGRSLRTLARAFGLEEELAAIDRAKGELGLIEREVARRIAALFACRSLRDLYGPFDAIPLTPGAAWWIRGVRARGWPVGLVSDSWHPLVARLGRRLGVDAVWANQLPTSGGHITGELLPPPCPAELPPGCRQHAACKLHALETLAAEFSVPPEHVLAVGDGAVDVCMLRRAGLGVALNPKAEEVAAAADLVVHGDFYDLAEAVGVSGKEEPHVQGSRPGVLP